MLERYDVKMSCTVLRREKAGNRFFLSDAYFFDFVRIITWVTVFLKSFMKFNGEGTLSLSRVYGFIHRLRQLNRNVLEQILIYGIYLSYIISPFV